MLSPFRSKFDPETQGEGSIDPLGLMSAADRLADSDSSRFDGAHVAAEIFNRDCRDVGNN